MTAQLSWHVQNNDMMWSLLFKLQHHKFSWDNDCEHINPLWNGSQYVVPDNWLSSYTKTYFSLRSNISQIHAIKIKSHMALITPLYCIDELKKCVKYKMNHVTMFKYSHIQFLQNTHKRHSTTHPWGQGIECPLWVHNLNRILHLSLSFSTTMG